jgi:hypothetical protein
MNGNRVRGRVLKIQNCGERTIAAPETVAPQY